MKKIFLLIFFITGFVYSEEICIPEEKFGDMVILIDRYEKFSNDIMIVLNNFKDKISFLENERDHYFNRVIEVEKELEELRRERKE